MLNNILNITLFLVIYVCFRELNSAMIPGITKLYMVNK